MKKPCESTQNKSYFSPKKMKWNKDALTQSEYKGSGQQVASHFNNSFDKKIVQCCLSDNYGKSEALD